MLGIWLGMAMVNISGYQPIAEQTWVQLNPEYYPLQRTPPAMFVAWRGNQFHPGTQEEEGALAGAVSGQAGATVRSVRRGGRAFKAYLARLRRIDEAAYGLAPVVVPLTSTMRSKRWSALASPSWPSLPRRSDQVSP